MVGSAGGLDAYMKFFDAVPADSGMAFVLIPHLDPRHESMMVELIARHTRMPVREAAEGEKLAPNRVYVIPPNKYLSLCDGVLHLSGPLERGGFETAIDAFLRSLADHQQEQAIGVIFSGTGSHGTLGVKAIKAVGGMIMAQDPETAEQQQMPRSAIATGLVDYVLAPEAMPEALLKYTCHFLGGVEAPLPARAEPDYLAQILALLRARTRFDFRSYRKRMLLRRVQRRMILNHFDTIADYVKLLRERPEEIKQLTKDLLICVTSFFRDREMYRLLESQILPDLLRAKAADAPLRIWVPACATGEEAYSVAMLAAEQITAAGKACPLQVFATDVEADALDIARHGVYAESVLADVSPERRARFFTKVDEGQFQANKALREMILFAQQNLLSDAPFSKIDLISCRNLLIYLEPDVQQKVISVFHFALNEGGYLVLGPSETVGAQVDLFAPVSKKWRIYRRVGPSHPARIVFPIEPGERGRPSAAQTATRAQIDSNAELTRQLLIQDYAPAAALIRRNYEVLYYHGPTYLYLRQPMGAPTADLTELAREGLREHVHAAVHKAIRANRRVTIPGARVKRDGRYATVRVSARPLHGAAAEGLVLVSFEDETTARAVARRRGKADRQEASVARQLEHELRTTRAALRGTIEELEGANEELKASNEEIMSMNEELQSSNEELETSKEELQSLNEELSTVNAQLQEKVDELEAVNSDMANLQASADIATLYLGADHTIKRYSAPANALFTLIASDVGRPIEDIRARVFDPTLSADLDGVVRTLTPRENEVRTDDGRWHLRRITPYRTGDKRVEGVVVVYTEISRLKRAQEELSVLATDLDARVGERTRELQGERNFVAAVLDTAAALVAVVDRDGRVVHWNKACEQASGYSATEVLGQPAMELLERLLLPTEEEVVKQVFEELRADRHPNRHQNHWRHRDGSTRLIDWSNSCLLDEHGEVQYIIATGIDVSEQRRSEEEARQRRAELAHLHRVYTAGEFAAVMAHELNQPLAAIASYSEAGLQCLRRGELDHDALIKDLEQVGLQAQRAGQSIRELRRFLSKEEYAREQVDLNEVFRNAEQLLAPEAQVRGVRLELTLAETQLKVTAVPIQIEHVLVNLVRNALEAIRSAGTEAGTITVSTAAADGQAQVTVRDNGPGFDEEQRALLFERFYTTKAEGLGMGLAICRSIVEGLGGKIWAEHPPHGGAAFHFTLPLQS
jgi:two-component system CheB/CheR fusion protein